MSYGVSGEFGEITKYQVEHNYGCTVIWGSIPISDLCKFMGDSGDAEEMFVGTDIANRIGATFVVGSRECLDAMRNAPDLPVSPKRKAQADRARSANYSVGFVEWLMTGDRGMSSNAIAHAITGLIDEDAGVNHPHDSDDFGRCLSVIDALKGDNLTEKEILKAMFSVSPSWEALALEWKDLKMSYLKDKKACSKLISLTLSEVKLR